MLCYALLCYARYKQIRTMPGCDKFEAGKMLKYFSGHTHCNTKDLAGDVGVGFRVAGFGMGDGGPQCDTANFGIPLVDTTEGRVRVWYVKHSIA